MPDPIIQMTGGVIRQQKNTILKNVNIQIQSGEFVYLIGKVGSGKSSLLKTLYAELPLEYGNAEVAGFQLKKIRKSQVPLLRRKCGIVFQDFKLLTDRDVYRNLEFVLRATGWKNNKAIRERIQTVLEKVGMTDKEQKMPHQLSGGEQQRIVLARALLNAPPLILADEPTGNIDPETSYQLIELLKEICATGKTIIIATHQYDLIEKYPGRVLCCENGELSERLPATACVREQEEKEQEYTTPLAEMAPEVVSVEVAELTEDPVVAGSLESPVSVEHRTDEVMVTEKKDDAEEFPQAAANASLPDADLPLQPDATSEEDILELIGKLDYPEISAFDYELESLPEIKADQVIAVTAEEMPLPASIEVEQAKPVDEAEETTGEKTTDSEPEADPAVKNKPQPPVFDLELID